MLTRTTVVAAPACPGATLRVVAAILRAAWPVAKVVKVDRAVKVATAVVTLAGEAVAVAAAVLQAHAVVRRQVLLAPGKAGPVAEVAVATTMVPVPCLKSRA